MLSTTAEALFARFAAAADAVAAVRPDVEVELAREAMQDAATMLHNSLALDGLDEHDLRIVVDCLCAALVDADPGDALRARAQATLDEPGELRDPQAASAAYLVSASVLKI